MNKTLKLTMTALAMAMPGMGSLSVGKWCHFLPLFGMSELAALPFQISLTLWHLSLAEGVCFALGCSSEWLWRLRVSALAGFALGVMVVGCLTYLGSQVMGLWITRRLPLLKCVGESGRQPYCIDKEAA
jgi:hypothetical protein